MSKLKKNKKKESFFSKLSLWDRFNFVNSKRSKSQTQRIRAQRTRSVVRSWVLALSFVSLIILGSISLFFGVPHMFIEYTKNKVIDLSGSLGLTIQDVFIEGRTHVPSDTILKTIQVNLNTPILSYNIEGIREQLEKIDWIKTATVRRQLPHLLYIHIVERKPIALWQQQDKTYLVDEEGVVISGPINQIFLTLPIIVGNDAPLQAPKLIKMIDKFPELKQRLTSISRIRNRRWDIILDEKLTVKLPEDNLQEALARLSLLIEQKKINPLDVSSIDLRIPKQVILKLTPQAALNLKIKGKAKLKV